MERDRLGDTGVDGEDNIKMDLEEVGCEVMDRMEFAQDPYRWRVVMNAVMNLRVP